MVNRLNGWLHGEDVPSNYWIVSSEVGNIAVSGAEAERVLESLGGPDAQRWITFRDLFGSRHRIRSNGIDAVWESTPEQRRRRRRFDKQRRAEADNDCNPWEEE